MEGITTENREGGETGWVGQERGLLARFAEIPGLKPVLAALSLLTVQACAVHVAEGSRTQIGGQVTREGYNNTRPGNVADLCRILQGETYKPGTQKVTGQYRYTDGTYYLKGFKLPDGRVVTVTVTDPRGKSYDCQN